MAEVSLSLAGLFEAAFGYKSGAFAPQFYQPGQSYTEAFADVFAPTLPGATGDKAGNRLSVGVYGGTYYGNDANGREVFLPVRLSFPTKTATGDNGQGVDWFLNYAVVSIQSNKTIVKTAMTERQGEVIEVINTNSYDISIKALLIAQTNDMPEADVTMLRECYECNVPIQMRCALTDIFLVPLNANVVITGMSLPEVKGVKNVRPIELKLVSDSIFNLVDIT